MLLLALHLLTAAVPQESTPRPNVVLFVVDDMGWRDPAFLGSEFHRTPAMDALAASGMVFVNAYANAPNCAPSRACLLTGQYTPRHGVYTVASPARGPAALRKLVPIASRRTLPDATVTLAEALRGAGYATCHVGKWHLGRDPRTQGFDHNVAGNRAGSPPGGHFAPYANPDLPDGPESEHLTDRLTDEALQWVRAHRDRRFFLHLSHYAVHTPIQAPADLAAEYRRRPTSHGQENAVYAAMIEGVDRSLARIVAGLDALGLREDTLVVLFSVNGGHGPTTSMRPLRGSKGMLYEGGIRVPLAVSWPGVVPPGSRCEVPVMGADICPTVLEAAKVTPPAPPIDGLTRTIHERPTANAQVRPWRRRRSEPDPRRGCTPPPVRTRPTPCQERTCTFSRRAS